MMQECNQETELYENASLLAQISSTPQLLVNDLPTRASKLKRLSWKLQECDLRTDKQGLRDEPLETSMSQMFFPISSSMTEQLRVEQELQLTQLAQQSQPIPQAVDKPRPSSMQCHVTRYEPQMSATALGLGGMDYQGLLQPQIVEQPSTPKHQVSFNGTLSQNMYGKNDVRLKTAVVPPFVPRCQEGEKEEQEIVPLPQSVKTSFLSTSSRSDSSGDRRTVIEESIPTTSAFSLTTANRFSMSTLPTTNTAFGCPTSVMSGFSRRLQTTDTTMSTSFLAKKKKRLASLYASEGLNLQFKEASRKRLKQSVEALKVACPKANSKSCSHIDPATSVQCSTKAVGRSRLCKRHGGGRRCKVDGCGKASQGSSNLCVAHGGGKRCRHPHCTKLARGHGLCIPHGGGTRCSHLECSKLAQGGTKFCIRHGGGKRCCYLEKVYETKTGKLIKTIPCSKSAVSSTKFCVAHGGGKRCQYPQCQKSAVGGTKLCVRHGGGRRCQISACGKSAVGKSGLCISHGGKR